jgi:hypothetical protein
MSDDRITNLEIKLSFTEDLIDQLTKKTEFTGSRIDALDFQESNQISSEIDSIVHTSDSMTQNLFSTVSESLSDGAEIRI